MIQLRARMAFVLARERQIPLGGARLSPQARRFDPLPVFGHRALAFARLLLVQSTEIMLRGRYGLSRLAIILLRLDHESGLRRRGSSRLRRRGGQRGQKSSAEKQGDRAAPRR
ncbi:MAG: hypothetical protein WA733_23145 [Methylocystis sp.]